MFSRIYLIKNNFLWNLQKISIYYLFYLIQLIRAINIQNRHNVTAGLNHRLMFLKTIAPMRINIIWTNFLIWALVSLYIFNFKGCLYMELSR